MSKLHVKTGDTVVLLTGDYKDKFEDKGKRKTGKVLEVSPKPNRMGQSGSLIRAESPIYASKVQLVCPKCGKPTRVGHGFEVKTNAAGEEKKTPVRICKKCGHNF